ncbi:MAG: 3-hydroxyacyl-CoA dehydrogenase NAD-binding domain-containing protein [Rhodoblastus sp.]|uniref:3-hydroxyacyl-CoA dehydrogenase NAD-binding domain-containing protein n=1 Tax=Rhodoblastus sp. TaxID=1962975 RepID=UPI003F962E45
MNLTQFRLETDSDGIALVTWDVPGKNMNLINAAMMSELEQIVDATTADANVKGVVVASGKDHFSGGADLTMLEASGRALHEATKREGADKAMQAFFDATSKLSLIYRKIETCGNPWAVAINGTCVGGGFELALACHHRVMADDDKTRVGLPEIKIGLFPGGGGTTRVARLMPTPDALQMLLKGDQIKPAAAKAKNLVHALAPRAEIVQKAKDWIKTGGKAGAPWDVKEFRAPSGKVFSPGGMMIWPPANAIYRRETYDNYPAARAILQCVYEGLQLPMDLALRVESRWFAKILRSKEAAAMIRTLFVSMGELNKGARRPKNIPPTSIKKIGVLGAGFMGAGIAYVSALAGLEVVLIDRDQAAADKGKAHAESLLAAAVKKGRSTEEAKARTLALIQPAADYAALAGVDLIVEAVFEDRAVKAEATAKALAVVGPEAIFASNTSTLPITSLATNWPKPENFIGVHFFSPVDKMLLVETILGEKTGDRALAVALDFIRAIRKTPIVVNDSRGFFANRCVTNYLREGHLMLMEGVPAAMIENVARMAGMPVGPLSLNDEVALDLGWRILQATKADLGPQAVDPAQEKLLEEMVVKLGRLGRKNGKGFYDYPAGAAKKLWPGLADLPATKLDPDTLDVSELKQRLLVVQAVEAARTVEDGVVTDPREADVGSIIGFGFAPFTGGALSYIDFMGVKNFVALCDRLAAKYGARFAPPALLREMAEKGETFYGRFGVKQAA